MRSGPVRQDTVGSMHSGPLSDVSRGAVTSGQSMSGSGSVAEHSAGAVKHNLDRSVGEQVYDLQRALGPLQERMRRAADSAPAEIPAEAADQENDGASALEEGAEALAPEAALPAEVGESTDPGNEASEQALAPTEEDAAEPQLETGEPDLPFDQ